MKNFQKLGGFAAFYLAIAYLAVIPIFIFILDYPNIVELSQKMDLIVKGSHDIVNQHCWNPSWLAAKGFELFRNHHWCCWHNFNSSWINRSLYCLWNASNYMVYLDENYSIKTTPNEGCL